MTISELRLDLPILSFETGEEFEAWLSAEPRSSRGFWLRLAKKGSGTPSVGKAEAIDSALCHGWIDGQQHPYDASSWLTRFSPRRAASRWSQINRARALVLIGEGRMQPAGLAEIEAAKADGRWEAAYAPASTAEPSPDLQAALEASPSAAAFFATLTGANRYAVIYRIATLKTHQARARRIAAVIAMLERGDTFHG